MAWGLLDVTPKAGSVRQKFGKLDFVTWKNLGFHIRNGAVKAPWSRSPRTTPTGELQNYRKVSGRPEGHST